MIYRFKSPAAGDVIMLGPQGDQLMRLLGREPAVKGIFEAADLLALRARLDAAIAAEPAAADDDADQEASPSPVGLKQRLWPIMDMMNRCAAEREPIVWGV